MNVNRPDGFFIADAHEDLAYHCHEYGRDLADPGDVPCMITLPWLLETGVRLVCATLFTAPGEPNSIRRYKLNSQYEQYQSWFRRHEDLVWPVRSRVDLHKLAGAPPVEYNGVRGHPVGFILLMEGCDLLTSPAEMATWFNRGVRLVGMTWNGYNQYAGGCFGDGRGVSATGHQLLKEIERLGMVLDLAHLNEVSIGDALGAFHGPVCSSHSNARAMSGHERNLTDPHAREIAARGGVIGLNLLAPLVVEGWRRGMALPTVAAAIDHVAYLAGLVGDGHVGLGTDLDGGLTPENTPRRINRINDLPLLADELRARDWPADAVARFMGRNWWDFFERSLPD